MFARIAVVAATLAAASTAVAADSTLADLSRDTGVSERHIRMVAGARTPYPEYRIVYDRVERQLKEALGQEGYRHLLKGEVAAASQIHKARIAATAAREPAREPAKARAKES